MKAFSSFWVIIILVFPVSCYSQQIITHWDFDMENLLPQTGEGMASNTGGTISEFVAGNPAAGKGWNTLSYPDQSTLSGTAGVQFNVSTANFKNIAIHWDNRNSNTAANRLRLKYTLDGINWNDFNASALNAINNRNGQDAGFDNGRYITPTASAWYIRSADFTEIAGVINNPNFAIRLVTEFMTGELYAATDEGSVYGKTGTIRYDNVSFSGLGNVAIPTISSDVGKVFVFDNNLIVEFAQPTSAMISIINMHGQIVSEYSLKGSFGKYLLNLPSGLYLVKTNTAFDNYIVKVLIN